jgi:outer membrane biogenesis lipoprotein LolB
VSFKRFAAIAVAGLSLALSGCASSLKQDSAGPLVLSPAPPKPIENFSVAGRFSAKRGDQQGNGQFRYTQRGAVRALDLFSPTSTQIARIEADGSSARATLSDNTVREAATLSELLRQFIDIPLTDREFSAWLQAVPLGVFVTYGSDSRIESFRESGWTVVVNARFDGEANFPRRMRWSFDAGGDGSQNAEVRWVFDEFSTQ